MYHLILRHWSLLAYILLSTPLLILALRIRDRMEQKSQMFLNSVVDNIPNMLFIKDAKELRFLRFNRAGQQLLGFPEHELLGKNDYDFFPADQADFFTKMDREVLDTGKRRDIPEETIKTKDGQIRVLHTKKIALKDPNGKTEYLLGISEDITEQKQTEAEIRKLNEELEFRIAERTQELLISNQKLEKEALERNRYAAELERSNKELEQFAYVASHDLQEPLRTVANYVKLLRDKMNGPLEPETEKYINYVLDSSDRMKTLIDDLLSFSRVGNVEAPNEEIDTNLALSRAISNLSASIQESGAKITFDPLPHAKIEEIQLTQLFQNLISNALKFRREDPPKIHIKAIRQGDDWQFSVSDNGIGIGSSNFDRIFLIFQRLHTRKQYPGTGVGLAICKKIVERHGGRIWIESEQGKGTTFLWTVPGDV